jgi:hypothetical protein
MVLWGNDLNEQFDYAYDAAGRQTAERAYKDDRA